MTYKEAIAMIQEDECADCYAPIEECRKCSVGLAIEALEKMKQRCGNCTYHNDGDYWCCERNLDTDDDMWCTDWSDEE